MTDKKNEADATEGSGIPGVVGAIAKLGNTAPVKGLLGPAFSIFGKYYGERAEEIVERWRRKRLSNLEAHRDKVIEAVGAAAEREPSEKQLYLVNEWIEGAQEVPPEDNEISALWESLLAAIYKNDDDCTILMSAIKKLDASEAKLIVHFPDSGTIPEGIDVGRFTKLENLGVLKRANVLREVFENRGIRDTLLNSYLFIAAFGLACSLIPTNVLRLFLSIPLSRNPFRITPNEPLGPVSSVADDYFEVYMDTTRVIFFFVFTLLLILVVSRHLRRFGTYRLTAFGQRIKLSGQSFLKSKTS